MGRAAYLCLRRGPSALTRPTALGQWALPMLRKLLLPLFVALLAAGPASAQGSLEARLRHALAVPHVSAALSGAAVLDLATGRPVFGHNDGLALAPASNEKLAVAYAAIS